MSEAKVVVPEGMLEAAGNIVPEDGCWDDIILGGIVEAALHWLSENPIVPTHAQAYAMEKECPFIAGTPQSIVWCIETFQRRMFRAPEPEVPEAVKDLLYMPPEFGLDVTSNRECLNEQILEAYRRGLRDK